MRERPRSICGSASRAARHGGVIGRQRILFDLWGATVNTASRMESHGISGHIQVAESTWQRLGRPAELEPREIEVKGLGAVTAYVDRPAT